jgi:Fe-S-cluster containining protein
MVERLESIRSNDAVSCLDDRFRRPWEEACTLLERYQRAIIEASGMKASCTKGCAVCCCHWVEDVNSFEAEIIVDYLKKNHAERIPYIAEKCLSDNGRLKRLETLVEQKLAAASTLLDRTIDGVDLRLASFYQLGLECPLLEKGECMVYQVRPITCRMYVSFSDPLRCRPEYIYEGATPTYLFDPGEEVDRLIDKLHFKYMKFEGDTGLRSLLAKYLS